MESRSSLRCCDEVVLDLEIVDDGDWDDPGGGGGAAFLCFGIVGAEEVGGGGGSCGGSCGGTPVGEGGAIGGEVWVLLTSLCDGKSFDAGGTNGLTFC